jgi:hypothetical protein
VDRHFHLESIMKKNYHSLIVGGLFIVTGMVLLLEKFKVINFSWHEFYPFLLMGIGVVHFLRAVKGQTNYAFWGTGFLTLGFFFFLRNFDIVEDLWFSDVWPVFLIALGLGFIVLFAFRPTDWALIIPGFFLTIVGILLFMDQMDLSWWYGKYITRNFWPLVLVAIGAAMIVSSLTKRPKN